MYAEEIAAANAELDAQQAELQKYITILESIESVLDSLESYTLGMIDLEADIPADLIDVGVTGDYEEWSRISAARSQSPGCRMSPLPLRWITGGILTHPSTDTLKEPVWILR